LSPVWDPAQVTPARGRRNQSLHLKVHQAATIAGLADLALGQKLHHPQVLIPVWGCDATVISPV
jgi:hypothetical protein